MQEEYNDFSLLLSHDDAKSPNRFTSLAASTSGDGLKLGDLLDGFFAVDKRDLSCEKCKDASAQVEVCKE
jgi:hypothetical protein